MKWDKTVRPFIIIAHPGAWISRLVHVLKIFYVYLPTKRVTPKRALGHTDIGQSFGFVDCKRVRGWCTNGSYASPSRLERTLCNTRRRCRERLDMYSESWRDWPLMPSFGMIMHYVLCIQWRLSTIGFRIEDGGCPRAQSQLLPFLCNRTTRQPICYHVQIYYHPAKQNGLILDKIF